MSENTAQLGSPGYYTTTNRRNSTNQRERQRFYFTYFKCKQSGGKKDKTFLHFPTLYARIIFLSKNVVFSQVFTPQIFRQKL